MSRMLFVAALLAAVLAETPSQIHLSFTGNVTAMAVSWLTRSAQETSVAYGSSPSALNSVSHGTSMSYNATVGYVHQAVMTGLLPATRYYYRCSGDNAPTLMFDTAPSGSGASLARAEQKAAGRAAPLYSVGVFGDLGVDESDETRARLSTAVEAGELQWIFHLGDISYAGDYAASQYAAVLDKFFDEMQPVMSRIPYMTAVGNNDRGCKNDTVCKGELRYTYNFTDYRYRFRMPAVESGSSGGNMFWSFDYGLAHWVAISTETDFAGAVWGPNTGAQLAWLEADLKRANLPENRAQRPWIIVCGHRPIYTSIIIYNAFNRPIGDTAIIQKAFEKVFVDNHVDIYFNGHIHGYERNWAVNDSRVVKSYHNAPYPIHIMSGAPGDIEGQDPAITYSLIKPDWTAFRLVDPNLIDRNDTRAEGYGVLHFHNATTLEWEFIRAHDNKVMDTAFIVKDRSER